GSSSCGEIPWPSSVVKDISGVGGKEECPTRYVSEMVRLTYRFLAELDSPPPENPPTMVFTAILVFEDPSSFPGGSF
ncbi:hypothetical protein A2U01_0091236, partial [Trifolium medium]|nr:hypothetical protein [Trifolium medium]